MQYKVFRRIPGEGKYAVFTQVFASLDEIIQFLQENAAEFDFTAKIYMVGEVSWEYNNSIRAVRSYSVFYNGHTVSLSDDRGLLTFMLGDEETRPSTSKNE